jgi:hypothetical protein
MNPVDVMNHTLSALLDSQKPKRPDPPYDRTCRVEVTVEILVPVWADGDEDGWNVTLSPQSEWKLAEVGDKVRQYIEEQCQQEVDEADCRRKRDDWERAQDGRGEYERDAQLDRYAMREGK